MVCRECGTSYVPFRFLRLFVRKLARMADRAGKARGKPKRGCEPVSPTVTDLVALLERGPCPTSPAWSDQKRIGWPGSMARYLLLLQQQQEDHRQNSQGR
jgi:hypothetical protein